ncbi:hypothetical protein CYY_005098 [Polysphondylium violaceum]|uniref:RAVE complex protein Rav1 C-terminal domain-containing protein n=1 Tax=Polysphondylium violaceum TaxID=133409 RepID=A0A8J4PUA7_9MYCE|nr:hypothetical protein CYY_005098 [Polysphondylium violaceum]
MNPSHIITGSANSSSTTFVYTHIDEDIYYAYSSGPIVYILKGASLKVVQVLNGHKSDVTALAWLSYDSKLITSSGSEIFLYTFNQSKTKWEKVFTLPNPFEVQTMAWLTSTSIIQQRLKELQLQKRQEQDLEDDGSSSSSSVATSNFATLNNYNTGSKTSTPPYGAATTSSFANPITRLNNDKFLLDQKLKEQKIFDKQAQIIWRTDSASPIQHLSASPDGSLFATAGKYDRMLKVWFVQKTANKNKLSQEEVQLNAQIQHLEYLQQQEQLQRKQKEKGLYKQQFNRLVNKEAVYTAPKKINSNTDDNNSNDGSGSGATSPKAAATNEPSLEEQQQQLQRLKDMINKKKNNKFEAESYGFVYLPHPRSITWISWRSRVTSTHNILLTNCRDGVVRLWQQYPQSRRLQFNVSNIIPSGSDVIDWVHSLNEERVDIFAKNIDSLESNSNSNNNNSSSKGSNSKSTSTSSNNNNNNSDKDNNSYLRNHDLKLHLTNPILLRQKDSLAKTKPIVDWIVGVKNDGSLVLWKLRTDDSTTKQTSSLSIWTNSQILTPQEIGPNRIIALYQPVSLSDNTPLSVKVCFNSFNGAITSRRFFIQNQNHTQISNTSPASRCFGHKNPIKSLSVSRTNPFMASLDERNNVVLWSSSSASKIQSPFFIIDLASFPAINSVAWSPNEKYCFFSNREGIFVYCIETHDSGSSLLSKSVPLSVGQIQDSWLPDDWFEEIHLVEPCNLIYYTKPQEKTQSNVFLPYQYFLVALNKQFDKVYVWGVSIERDFRTSSASAPSILLSKLLATHEYERYNRLTCMCPAPKGISDRILLPNPTANELDRQRDEPTNRVILDQPIVITGSVEGAVSLLSIAPKVIKKREIASDDDTDNESVFDLEDWEIKVMAHYDAYKQPVESVKPAYYGRFASKPFSTNFNPEIHIWELESHTPKFKLEDTIKFFQPHEEEEKASKIGQAPITISLAQGSDSIQFSSGLLCMYSFAPLDNGSYSLAMGYGNQIKVLCKPVDRTIGSYKKPWSETHTFNHLSASCRAIEWANDMTLYVASGNQILIFTKWTKPTNEHLHRHLQDSTSASNLDSIYHQHSWLQRPLPVYHPKFLSEYMLAGKFNTVDKILNHLSKYLIEKYGDLDDIPKTPAFIPPIPLETLSSDTPIDNNNSGGAKKKHSTLDDVDTLNASYYNNDDDDEDNDEDEDDLLDLSGNDGKFTKRIATKLNEILSSIKLANLTNTEQIQLLAVTDTYGEIGDMRGGLDENGSRFLIIAKIFQFLRRSLAPKDRPISLGTTDILWAMHSEAQETILQTIFPTDPDWEALKQIGAGLWIKSPSTLKDVVEKLARTTYQLNRQASDCSLYYMALKKKGTLIALHKAAKDTKHVEFLQQDFSQPKWITAASKSAFLMQSKHRYEVAASLFLLAGQLKQAVNLIIQTTGDFQLALVISRLYEGENGDITKMIIEDHVIPLAKKSNDRSLMSICYWLTKRYEEAFTVLIPSTPLDNEKKLDDVDYPFSPVLSGASSPSVSLMQSGSGFRTSSATSPRPPSSMFTPGGASNAGAGGVHQRDKQISVQLKSSEMGPSVLYFFRFLRNHTLLRNIPEDKKKEDPFLRNSAYSYSNSGCALLALENMKLLDSTRPPILTDKEIEELDEKDRLEQESKYERDKLEKQKKQQKQSNDLGLDFGGGSSSSYFNNNSSSSNDMGLDFGGGSSYFSNNRSSTYDMGLDFNTPSKPANNSSMMGLDFGSPPKSNTNTMGLDFGSPPKSNSNTMGLDFGSPPKSNSNTMGLDFGSPPKSNSNTMGLDFGSPPKSNSNTMGLDFGSPPKSKSNMMGLDFGSNSPPKSSGWSYDQPTIITTDENNTTTTLPSANKEEKEEKEESFKFSRKERTGKEVLSLYPLIDDELKTKLLVKLLIENIMECRESDPWSDKIDSFVLSLNYLVEKYNLNRVGVVEQLMVSCFDRQYFFQCVLLAEMIDRKPIDYLEGICTNIMKSIYRVDEDGKPVIKSQSHTTILTAIELYVSYCEACKLENRVGEKSDPLILSTVYTTLFVASWCASRFDILFLILSAGHQGKSMDSIIDELVKMSKVSRYTDDSLNYEMDTDEEDEAALINEDEAQKKALENIAICKTLSNLFDLLVLKYFKAAYDQFYNNLAYHQVFDLIHQRVNLWIGTASAKLLVIPKPLTEIFAKKPQNTAGENLIEYIKSFAQFNTRDQIETWNIVKSDNDLLETTILGPDHKKRQGIIGGGSSSSSASGTGKYRFEDEIELYKDSDLLQSFCIDPTSPDLSRMAIATTRGIREIDLKQNAHDNSSYRDDFDMDSQLTETVASPSSHSRKLRVSSKTATSLHGHGTLGAANGAKPKANVFKSAISSLTKPVDHNMIVQCLESHPNSSFYLSGGIDGSVCLWQYGLPEVLTAYQLPQKPRIVRCKFNQSGTKFGACDISGNLLLWQFAAQEDTLKPFYTLQAHSKQTLDFTFLNSGSLLATAGISSDSGRDVCLWDVLLPPNKSLIASYTDQESGAASIVYSPKRQTIIVGGKKGTITLYDIRTNKTLDSFKGHGLNTKTLALDPYEEFVCSGSSDGSIKVWSLPSLTCLNTFEDTHKKQTFVRPTGVFKSPVSTYGVMQVRLENNNIFSCGSDGRLLKRKYTKVYNY